MSTEGDDPSRMADRAKKIKALADDEKAVEAIRKESKALEELQASLDRRLESYQKSYDALTKLDDLHEEFRQANALGGYQQQEAAQQLLDAQQKLDASLAKLTKSMKKVGLEGEEVKRVLEDVGNAGFSVGAILEKTFEGSRGVIGGLINDAIRLKKGFGNLADALSKFAAMDKEFVQGGFMKSMHSFLQETGGGGKLERLGNMIEGMGSATKNGISAIGESLKKYASTGDWKGLGPWMASTAQGISKLGAASLAAAGGVLLFIGYIAKLAIGLDTASRNLAKGSGDSQIFAKNLMTIHKNNLMAGVSIEDVGNGINALRDNFSGFDSSAVGINNSMGETVSLLDKLGVGMATSSKTMDYFNRVTGKGKIESANMTRELVMMGRAMDKTGEQFLSDFASVSGSLAVFGDRSTKVFGDLAAQAKASGMAVGQLVKIAEGFNTFDKAADNVAKMNAVLGTQLSTIDIMNMSYEDRIKYIREEVSATVGNLEDMDMYTQQMIAQAMGASDVAEAQRMLNMSQDEYLENLEKQKSAAKDQEALKKVAEDLVPVTTRLALVFKKFILTAEPAIMGFMKLFQMMAYFASAVLNFFDMVADGLGIVYEIFKFIFWVIGGIAAILAVFEPVSKMIGVIVAVVWGLAWALGYLYDVLHLSGSPMLYAMPEFLAKGFKALGDALMFPIRMILKLVNSLGKLYTAYKQGGGLLKSLLGYGGETVEAAGTKSMVDKLNNLNTDKLSSGLTTIKSNLAEISSISGKGGFLTMKADGPKAEVVMASDNVMAQAFGGRLAVDVNIPKQAAPQTTVKVYIDGEAVQNAVARVIEDAG
jgi:hypothetical protein